MEEQKETQALEKTQQNAVYKSNQSHNYIRYEWPKHLNQKAEILG